MLKKLLIVLMTVLVLVACDSSSSSSSSSITGKWKVNEPSTEVLYSSSNVRKVTYTIDSYFDISSDYLKGEDKIADIAITYTANGNPATVTDEEMNSIMEIGKEEYEGSYEYPIINMTSNSFSVFALFTTIDYKYKVDGNKLTLSYIDFETDDPVTITCTRI